MTYIPDPSNSAVPSTNPESQQNRYVQIATFENPSIPIDKYFMVINRRCSPYDANVDNGGRRFIKIQLDANHSDFSGFNNWKIIDVSDSSTEATFNKNVSSTIDLTDFLPGEGRLYKISPVMQEGGTLVADESLLGANFVCKGMVNNNGKNVSLLSGTKIQFKTGAGISMSGANLICNNNSNSPDSDISLKGYSGQSWNGITLTNAGTQTDIQNCVFENSKTPLKIINTSWVASYYSKVIKENTFKMSEDSSIAVNINNSMSLLIDDNTFDITNSDNTIGLYINNDSEGQASGIPEELNYYLNITNNKFKGGYIPVLLHDLGSNYSTFYLYKNDFENTGLYGITGRKITGTIKQNRFINSSQNYSIYLCQSNPDLYDNTFKAEKRNMVLHNSYPNLSPIRNTNNQLVWKGGKNDFIITSSSDSSENISLKVSLPETHLGENNFTITNSYSYHLFGTVPLNYPRLYKTIRNCWFGYNDVPRIFLYNPLDTPVTPIGNIYIPTRCIPSSPTTQDITEQGFGLYDTTFISSYDSTDILPDDEALYSEAQQEKDEHEFYQCNNKLQGIDR